MYIPPPRGHAVWQLFFRVAIWPFVKMAMALKWPDRSYKAGIAYEAEGKWPEQGCLDGLNITYDLPEGELAHIPTEGPVLLVSNHPYGMGDGLLQSVLMQTVRPDCKQLVNQALKAFPLLNRRYITVDLTETPDAVVTNQTALRQAMEWLQDGHLLGMFPSGTVSHRTWQSKEVLDPAWNPSTIMLARRAKATIVPMHFGGRNPWWFQWAGLVWSRLRTLLIPRAYGVIRNRCIPIRIGRPIPAKTLASIKDRQAAIGYLRSRVYMMADTTDHHMPSKATSQQPTNPASTSVTDSTLAREVEALDANTILCSSGDFDVYISRADAIHGLLEEIGRLREISFRAVGEGSGNDLDLDEYDPHYRHLFVWSRSNKEIVGAYRVGLTDEILPAQGIDGLYTRTLFDYDARLLDQLGPSLELGRSFIRPEYQKTFKPLMLLWRGISTFAALERRYRHAFGVVSISDEYHARSKRLITEYLMRTRLDTALADITTARTPYQAADAPGVDFDALLAGCKTIEDVDELVRDIEQDRRPVPVLVRQYLKLDARLIAAFNVDAAFSNVVDGLMLVDFMQVERRIAHFYLGKELAGAFREANGFDPTFGRDE